MSPLEWLVIVTVIAVGYLSGSHFAETYHALGWIAGSLMGAGATIGVYSILRSALGVRWQSLPSAGLERTAEFLAALFALAGGYAAGYALDRLFGPPGWILGAAWAILAGIGVYSFLRGVFMPDR